jgi:hypothetical protein
MIDIGDSAPDVLAASTASCASSSSNTRLANLPLTQSRPEWLSKAKLEAI